MADNNIKIKITATDEASPTIKAAVDKLTQSMNKLTSIQEQQSQAFDKTKEKSEGLNSGLINLAAGFSVVKDIASIVSGAFSSLTAMISHCVEESLAAEKATNQLKGALISTGQYTRAASKDLEEYANSVEAATGVSEESVKSNIAMGVQMGLTAEKAKEMEKAARMLSAATGKDLETSFAALKTTLNGNARALAQYLPQVKEMSAFQLKNGDAIDIVTKKLEAQYELYEKSLPAAISRLTASYGNLSKSIGQAITQSPAVVASVNAIGEVFSKIEGIIRENSFIITDLTSSLLTVAASVIPVLVKSVGILDETFVNLVSVLRMAMAGATELFRVMLVGLNSIPGSILEKLGVDVQGLNQSMENFETSLFDNVSESNQALEKRQKVYDQINQVVEEGAQKVIAAGAITQQEAQKSEEAIEEQNEALSRQNALIQDNTQKKLDAAKAVADAMKGLGGSIETTAQSDVTVAQEAKRQKDLKDLKDSQLIDEETYQQALLESRQKAAEAQLQADMANQQARADLLGESEEGYALKQQIAEERFQLELEQKLERANAEMATEEEIFAMKNEQQALHDQQMLDAQDAHYAAIAQREEISGATVTATRQKWFREQEKAQAASIKNFASGVAMMESIQTAMNQTFNQLGDALVKNQKITASKFVGIFLEMLGRQVMQKGFADLVMGLFPPNPVQLGVGAAEVAGGTAIARLGVSMQGGQADEGMDAVPGSLAGKSFILSQGERVVQPSANKDLKDFLAKEKGGGNGEGGARGNSYNITLNYGGAGGEADARNMASIVIEEIRARSERGTPIMNEKGLVRT